MASEEQLRGQDVSLLDILDVVLDKGVALRGELVISIANIDLVYLDLRLLITSVEKLVQEREDGTIKSSREEMKEWNSLNEKLVESTSTRTM
ncbi:gas vesicle protein [Metabacillus sp. GX 13764]|uniref:gas vesicle protein n=1 Tax=Metabacillus kandeliae TaxID=2900151 RepID=UPI001E3F870F|nr:gas vesicle protein [Metabacillus kandeliae]MCD7033536.1 gas vesicle protein [Metabacillus kandeliae]